MSKAEDLEIHVTRISPGAIANLIYGYVLVKGEKIRFRAIAYGRYGGQNVSPKFSRKAVTRIKGMSIDFPDFEATVQRRLVEGELVLDAPREPSPHSRRPPTTQRS